MNTSKARCARLWIKAKIFSNESCPRIWIGVKTDPFSGKFVTQAGLELDERIADWAPGEPGSGDCVVADRSVGYKWKTASCVEANDYFCALREPICHPGYTWLPDIPSSCFKITRDPMQ